MRNDAPSQAPYARHIFICTGRYCDPEGKGMALYNSLAFGAGGTLGGLYSGWTWEGLGPEWTFTLAAGFAALAFLVRLRNRA